jgi:hypothetical protein
MQNWLILSIFKFETLDLMFNSYYRIIMRLSVQSRFFLNNISTVLHFIPEPREHNRGKDNKLVRFAHSWEDKFQSK